MTPVVCNLYLSLTKIFTLILVNTVRVFYTLDNAASLLSQIRLELYVAHERSLYDLDFLICWNGFFGADYAIGLLVDSEPRRICRWAIGSSGLSPAVGPMKHDTFAHHIPNRTTLGMLFVS